LAFNSEQTLLQQTALRLSHHIDPSHLYTVTHEDHKFEVKGQLGEVAPSTISKRPLMERGDLNVGLLGRGFAWLDTGTHESLLEAAMFVETIEKRQGYKIACLEEIAWRNGWLTSEQVLQTAKALSKNSYGAYLQELINE